MVRLENCLSAKEIGVLVLQSTYWILRPATVHLCIRNALALSIALNIEDGELGF